MDRRFVTVAAFIFSAVYIAKVLPAYASIIPAFKTTFIIISGIVFIRYHSATPFTTYQFTMFVGGIACFLAGLVAHYVFQGTLGKGLLTTGVLLSLVALASLLWKDKIDLTRKAYTQHTTKE